MPFVGILRALGLAKEPSVGTLTTPPTEFLPYIPPESFSPQIHTLESMGIRALPDKVVKATRGPAEAKGMKLKIEVEPENIGHILQAAFGLDTISGTALTGYTHSFLRQSVSQLPTYTVWVDGGAQFLQLVGSMLHKLDFLIKAKEFVYADTEWVALNYDNTGVSHSPTYSARKAFVFNEAKVKINNIQVNDYDNLKIAIDNMVKAEHALANTVYTTKIWTEGMRVTTDLDLYLENNTEYQNYLNGSTTSFHVDIISAETISGSSPLANHTLSFDVPVIRYLTAPFHNPVGVLKIPFTAVDVFDFGNTNKTISATLLNGVSTAY